MSVTTLNSIDDIQAGVKDSQQLHIVGNGTKTALAVSSSDIAQISLKGLRGITEYQPDEYTITAYAGTPVHEIQAELKKNGQYLPFDPMLAHTATIGGTVATNLSGSRRLRYGGVRDFFLGATVIDGLGRVFRVGGKVVKNSAGFDLTKFLVGSLGEYAIMTELTFKVFPDAPTFTTLKLTYQALDDLLSAIFFINQSVFELDALDFEADGEQWTLWVRMTGFADTLSTRSERFIKALKSNTALVDSSQAVEDNSIWNKLNDISWAQHPMVAKVVLTPKQIPNFENAAADSNIICHYDVGGNVAWVATDNHQSLDETLTAQNLTGLLLLGETDNPIIGKPIDNVLSDRVKQILDPENKFV